jgi:hypothetical protein
VFVPDIEKNGKKGPSMPEEQITPEYDPKDHPWIEMPADEDSLDEALRFTLDEIRIA